MLFLYNCFVIYRDLMHYSLLEVKNFYHAQTGTQIIFMLNSTQWLFIRYLNTLRPDNALLAFSKDCLQKICSKIALSDVRKPRIAQRMSSWHPIRRPSDQDRFNRCFRYKKRQSSQVRDLNSIGTAFFNNVHICSCVSLHQIIGQIILRLVVTSATDYLSSLVWSQKTRRNLQTSLEQQYRYLSILIS